MSTIEIPLTKGYTSLVDWPTDPEVEAAVLGFTWQCKLLFRGGRWVPYAVRGIWRAGKPFTLYLNRVVLGSALTAAESLSGACVSHHLDPHATLDNRRANLQILPDFEHRALHRRLSPPAPGKYKGVHRSGRCWLAQIGAERWRGFTSPEAAALFRDREAFSRYGWGGCFYNYPEALRAVA